MQIERTNLAGVFLITPDPAGDERGAFARLYCPEEFGAAGIPDYMPMQVNLSRNTSQHTLRGMHYQDAPHAEQKLVHVTRGAIHDVVIDLRKDSPTFLQTASARLDAQAMTALYIPRGCAHGFLTLEPETDVLYHMGQMFVAGHGRGIRWDDPAFGINWPADPAVIAERDAHYPDFTR